jgi:hypothetical protein
MIKPLKKKKNAHIILKLLHNCQCTPQTNNCIDFSLKLPKTVNVPLKPTKRHK